MSNKINVLNEYDAQSSLYKEFAFKVRQLLEEMLKSEKISYNETTCRVKDKMSLSKKIDAKKDKYKHLGDLTDIAGVRIITFYSDDVDKVAGLVEKEFEVDWDNSIDRRKSLEPDRFGYCSVHYVVCMSPERLKLREYRQYKDLKCEVQIRTVLQHAWAEIEHDLGYKSENAIPKDIRRSFSRLAGLLEIGDKEFLEIRKFLLSYTERIATKIEDSDLNDKELDMVILKEFTKTDKNMIMLRQEIEIICGEEADHDLLDIDFQTDIESLHWLNIFTLGQFKQMLHANKTIAIEIARELLLNDEEDDESEELHFSDSIATFYLCYAELLRQYHSQDSIRRYLNHANISYGKDFPSRLIEIQKKLGL